MQTSTLCDLHDAGHYVITWQIEFIVAKYERLKW
jgi:hypothetical protein